MYIYTNEPDNFINLVILVYKQYEYSYPSIYPHKQIT